ncbi:unnamed protein product [Calicophoron daubneyi]|uniref:Uncharacterized protein n=1 Tax=Calicophoron daubneyi TaxID=300641 RepID=A0AAV2T9G4_CALDB
MQVNFISWCFLRQRFLALPKSFYSRAVRKKQAVRDQTIYDLSTDYVHKGKQAYAFGFSATGALGVERLMIDRDKSFTKFSGVSQPVKLSFDKTQQLLNVACGYGFTVYISKSSGATYNLYGCGINSDGQLGQHEGLVGKLASEQLICAIPSPHEIDLPLSVEEKKRLYPTLVACGRAHTVISMGLRDETTNSQPFLLTLGNNAFGQCGRQIVDNEVFRPQTSAISRVHLPANVESVKQICCGQDHSLLLSTEGVVYAAGLGSDGQTGLGFLDPVDKFTPVQGVLRNEVIDQIASRGDTVLALSRTGKLYAWGNNEYGQIWPAADVLQVPEPVELPTDECIVPKEAGEEYRNSKIGRILSIACAGSMCAIVNDLGQVFVWGFGCLGLGPVVNFTALPTLIPPGLFVPALPSTAKRLVSVTSGLHHFIARSSDGSLWAWGAPRGGLYCLGIGAQLANKADRQTYPVPINLAAEAVDVACGVDHTVVLARSLG